MEVSSHIRNLQLVQVRVNGKLFAICKLCGGFSSQNNAVERM